MCKNVCIIGLWNGQGSQVAECFEGIFWGSFERLKDVVTFGSLRFESYE